MTDLQDALHRQPDLSVTSQSRVPCDAEFQAVDRQMGWLVVNRWTYRLLRAAEPLLLPKPDLTGVTVSEPPEAGPRGLWVMPQTRHGTGAVMLIHGGGYVIGSPKGALPLAVAYARALGVPVLCPGYALGPDAPFPAGHNALRGAWQWMLGSAPRLGIDPARVAIAGQSAGGGMAAGLVQWLVDEGGVQPAAQVLIYPMLDDRTATRSDLDKPRHSVWSNANNRFGWTSYLGHAPGAAVDPYAAPGRRKALGGQPPTWIGVGTADLFLDENRAYAEALSGQGVSVSYIEVPGGIHAFDGGGTPTGQAFVQAQIDFMRDFTG